MQELWLPQLQACSKRDCAKREGKCKIPLVSSRASTGCEGKTWANLRQTYSIFVSTPFTASMSATCCAPAASCREQALGHNSLAKASLHVACAQEERDDEPPLQVGLAVGQRCGIIVNDRMQSCDAKQNWATGEVACHTADGA